MRRLSFLVCLIIFFSPIGGVASAGDVTVTVDGKPVQFQDVEAFIDEYDRTQVPVRFVSEELGAEVGWEPETGTVIIEDAERTVRFFVGETKYIVNGEEKEMDTTARIVDPGRTVVPPRFVADALGLDISWDAETRTVALRTDDAFVPGPEPPEADEERGNTVGNIVNRGLAAKQDGRIYFAMHPDSGIFKEQPDGAGRTKLSDDTGLYLNVVEDWVYYANHDDGKKIYRMRTDGSDSTRLNDYGASQLNVVDGWIYYRRVVDPHDHEDEDPFKDGNIYKMRTDGSEHTLVHEYNELGSDYLNVVGDWVYYSIWEPLTPISRVPVEGGEPIRVNDEGSEFINVVDDWIYYSRECEIEFTRELYRVRTDGSQRTQVTDDAAVNLNVTGGWIYYTNTDDGYSMYKIRTDGSDRTKLNDAESRRINVVGDWVYYTEAGELYKMRTDGRERQQLAEPEKEVYEDVEGIYWGGADAWSAAIEVEGVTRSYAFEDDVSAEGIEVGDEVIFDYYKGEHYLTVTRIEKKSG